MGRGVIRVTEGFFSILKTNASSYITWDEKRAHKLAEEAAERLFAFKGCLQVVVSG